MIQLSPLMMMLIAPLSRSIMVFHMPLKMSLIPSQALSKSPEKTPEINLISPEKIVLMSSITFPTVCLMLLKTAAGSAQNAVRAAGIITYMAMLCKLADVRHRYLECGFLPRLAADYLDIAAALYPALKAHHGADVPFRRRSCL